MPEHLFWMIASMGCMIAAQGLRTYRYWLILAQEGVSLRVLFLIFLVFASMGFMTPIWIVEVFKMIALSGYALYLSYQPRGVRGDRHQQNLFLGPSSLGFRKQTFAKWSVFPRSQDKWQPLVWMISYIYHRLFDLMILMLLGFWVSCSALMQPQAVEVLQVRVGSFAVFLWVVILLMKSMQNLLLPLQRTLFRRKATPLNYFLSRMFAVVGIAFYRLQSQKAPSFFLLSLVASLAWVFDLLFVGLLMHSQAWDQSFSSWILAGVESLFQNSGARIKLTLLSEELIFFIGKMHLIAAFVFLILFKGRAFKQLFVKLAKAI